MNNDLGQFDLPGLYPARPCRDETASGFRAQRTTFCGKGSRRTSNGVAITELSNSTIFAHAGGNGLKHKTAWAGAGDGVLLYDPAGLGTIEEKRQYVFTERDPTATSDMEALRSVFDSTRQARDFTHRDRGDRIGACGPAPYLLRAIELDCFTAEENPMQVVMVDASGSTFDPGNWMFAPCKTHSHCLVKTR